VLLGTREVTVDFPGTRALDNVSITVDPGEVLAVVGANGSGKTTLLSVLAGVRRPTSGTVVGEGGPISFRNPRRALKAGIALVPQEPQLALTLSSWENLTLGRPTRYGLALGRRRRERAVAAIREALPHVDPERPALTLRKDGRAVLALLAALERKPRLLALDEPTAVLGERSVEIVADAVERVRARGGAVVLVSHRLRDVVQLATRVAVLVDGRLTYEGEISSLTVEEIVDRMAHGRMPITEELLAGRPRSEAALQEVVLRAKGIRSDGGLSIDELDVRGGEIVGIAGLSGSGRSRLLRVLGGSAPVSEGELILRGRRYEQNVRWARRSGVGYVPEDRAQEAIFPPLSVSANLAVGRLTSRPLLGRASRRREVARAASLRDRFAIRTPSLHAPITVLSGGNQQRVVLARALADDPALLVADEPTHGVDTVGRSAIHGILKRFAADGGAVVLASSEFEELQDLCTRILVIRDGCIVAEFEAGAADYRTLVGLATGAHVGGVVPSREHG
jgi:ABC-type sugar transport system ATPase subunit